MKTLKNLFVNACANRIITSLVRKRCRNNCGAPGVFWLRLEAELEKLQAEDEEAPEELDYAVVFYPASHFWGDTTGSDLVFHFRVCPIDEFHRIPAFDAITLWDISDTESKYIGHLTEEEVDELLLIQVPSIDCTDFSFLLTECKLVAHPAFNDYGIACTFLERRMGLECWEPEDEIGSSLGEKRNLLWNNIAYYQVCTQLLEKDSAV